jgi:hypothetical protein
LFKNGISSEALGAKDPLFLLRFFVAATRDEGRAEGGESTRSEDCEDEGVAIADAQSGEECYPATGDGDEPPACNAHIMVSIPDFGPQARDPRALSGMSAGGRKQNDIYEYRRVSAAGPARAAPNSEAGAGAGFAKPLRAIRKRERPGTARLDWRWREPI